MKETTNMSQYHQEYINHINSPVPNSYNQPHNTRKTKKNLPILSGIHYIPLPAYSWNWAWNSSSLLELFMMHICIGRSITIWTSPRNKACQTTHFLNVCIVLQKCARIWIWDFQNLRFRIHELGMRIFKFYLPLHFILA